MKGFIEVHDVSGEDLLINANAIECITPSVSGKHTKIQTRKGKLYSVTDDYEAVKSLILKALTPSFTTFKEDTEND